ncbi:hypothetical protein BIY21_06400 [Vibrio ponticus]|uniref:Uncharacterized protein n=1 Tax=Vibrio ponticus TaxID=265668 RepID=A0ABX3FM91_9VIBR|nr:hypothetical protein [Vibrio ponticus]OLQ95331.1 hypothetical protein BIY21_06400 [Vibrio ponticus]
MSIVLKLTLAFVASVLVFFLTVIFVLNPLMKWQTENKPPVGASDNDHFIRVQGLKPIDAQVTATAIFYGGGEECRSFFWSASDGKKRQGAKAVFKIEHDFSPVPDRYELRIPYKNYQASGCDMTLWQINVGAKNAVDEVGFADLRISPPRLELDNVMALNSKLEAKKCEPYYSEKYDRWTNGFGCYFYFNGKKVSKEAEFNRESIYFDFYQFNDETIINYDILPGDLYLSVPL